MKGLDSEHKIEEIKYILAFDLILSKVDEEVNEEEDEGVFVLSLKIKHHFDLEELGECERDLIKLYAEKASEDSFED